MLPRRATPPRASARACPVRTREGATTAVCVRCVEIISLARSRRVGRCPRCRAYVAVARAPDPDRPRPRVVVLLAIARAARASRADNSANAILHDPRRKSARDACADGRETLVLYECARCGGVQRIPHPMWRYQPTPSAFGDVTWACHVACDDYTTWRVHPDDRRRDLGGRARRMKGRSTTSGSPGFERFEAVESRGKGDESWRTPTRVLREDSESFRGSGAWRAPRVDRGVVPPDATMNARDTATPDDAGAVVPPTPSRRGSRARRPGRCVLVCRMRSRLQETNPPTPPRPAGGAGGRPGGKPHRGGLDVGGVGGSDRARPWRKGAGSLNLDDHGVDPCALHLAPRRSGRRCPSSWSWPCTRAQLLAEVEVGSLLVVHVLELDERRVVGLVRAGRGWRGEGAWGSVSGSNGEGSCGRGR